jgi:hypothetical protein
MTASKQLSPARRRAIQALVSAPSVQEAAARARVREETLWRWLGRDEAFQEEVKQERRRQREAACIAAESLLAVALEALGKVLNDETAEAAARVEAARATFDIAVELYKLTILDERVGALEDWAKRRRGKKTAELKRGAAAAERPA